MEKYVVIVLMNISRSKPSENLIKNCICIILWRNMCMLSIREEITPNPTFQYSGPLFVILGITRNVDFGDTREVSLIGP